VHISVSTIEHLDYSKVKMKKISFWRPYISGAQKTDTDNPCVTCLYYADPLFEQKCKNCKDNAL